MSEKKSQAVLDKILTFYSNNKIDVLKVQMPEVEVNIQKGRIYSDTVFSQQESEVSEDEFHNESATINAPLVGTFYLSQKPDSPTFVKKGDYIEKGMVIGLIEAMKTFNEIHAEITGVVKEIMVADGQMVEHDQVLMEIEIQ